MKQRKRKRQRGFLDRMTSAVTRWVGSVWALLIAVAVVVAWAVTGPLFGFSEKWLLVINTGTTITTFLMVFIIQRSQNKDTLALHLKLNELIASKHGASNHLIDIESLTEEEVRQLHARYQRLATTAVQGDRSVHRLSIHDHETEAAPPGQG